MPVIVTHRFICDLCNDHQDWPRPQEEQRPLDLHGVFQLPASIPDGWSWVNKKLICPKHRILIDPPIKEGKPCPREETS